MVDRLWSSERIEFIHYGAHVTRPEKIAEVVALDPIALKNLRVCPDSPVSNCGKCYKCLRTMIPLDIVRKLKEASTFPDEVPSDLRLALVRGEGSVEDEPIYRLA